MSPDGLPLVGAPAGLENAVVVMGLGPSGLTLGPYAGALVADLLLGAPPPFDLRPFDPNRFAT